jgi:hypothetical protein
MFYGQLFLKDLVPGYQSFITVWVLQFSLENV